MKNAIILLAILCFICPALSFAQVPPVRHASAEVKEKQKEKSDYKEFRKQIAALKEFSEEKKKIPKLQKENKETVKVTANIDSVDGGDDVKTFAGFITQQIGDNSVNLYELTFDRATRKITTVKKTAEAIEAEAAEKDKEKPAAKPATAKKGSTAKKKKDEDGDDEEEADEPEEKPSKKPVKEDGE